MRQILFLVALVVSGVLILLIFRSLRRQYSHHKFKKAVLFSCIAFILCLDCITGYHASFPMIELNNTYIGEFHDLHYTFTWNGHHYTQQTYLDENYPYTNLKFLGYAEDMHMVNPSTSKISDLLWPRRIYVAEDDKTFHVLYLQGRSSGSDKSGLTFERID